MLYLRWKMKSMHREVHAFLYLIQERLQLPAVQGRVQGLGDPGEIRNHGGGFVFRIVLSEGYKIIMLPGQESTDVFRGAGQRVIGGYCD